jgi:hypothetical protein
VHTEREAFCWSATHPAANAATMKATMDAGRDAHHSGVGGLQRLLLCFERRGILCEILQRHRRRVQLARQLAHMLRRAFAQLLGRRLRPTRALMLLVRWLGAVRC